MGSDTRTEEERATDERAIRALHRRVLQAWDAGDGEAFAAPFSDDALFIGFDGSVMHGREQIASSHQEVFDRWMKGTRLVEERTEVRFVAPDVAIIHTLGGTVMRGKSEPTPERDSIQTLVAVRDAGGSSHFRTPASDRSEPGRYPPCCGCCPTGSGDSSSASPRPRRERSPGLGKRADSLANSAGRSARQNATPLGRPVSS
jgi:uncharacterized protein (TIGR02246 family)